MAYPKITVNTGLVLDVIASDTIPIFQFLHQIYQKFQAQLQPLQQISL
jgi:hypothetical protein